MTRSNNRKKSIVLRIVLLVFVMYLLYSLASLQIDLLNARDDLAEINEQIEQQTIANQELLSLLETGTEKDFIERAARDRLGYVYADEEVYTDIVGS